MLLGPNRETFFLVSRVVFEGEMKLLSQKRGIVNQVKVKLEGVGMRVSVEVG